jgi:hypothetical protein
MYVIYKHLKVKRNRNKKIFKFFLKNGYKLKQSELGRDKAYSYQIKDFYEATKKAFEEDIFIWLDQIPNLRTAKINK